MSRKARIDAAGAFHHIIARGIERRKLFCDEVDRQNFINRLSSILINTQTKCFAWALIPNHFHLLLRTGKIPIATVMRRLLTGYAVYFNHKYRRHGQLFQNRYKSILCQEDVYLKELVRYIHLNPLRTRLVTEMRSLDHYKWCGHSVIMGKNRNEWQDIDYVLLNFSEKESEARRNYRRFVQNGIKEGKRWDLTGGGLIRSHGGWSELKKLKRGKIRVKGDERILGDSDFVENVLKETEEEFERKYYLKSQGFNFDKVLNRVSVIFEMKPSDIIKPGKQKPKVFARSLLCYWANRELGITTVEIAKCLSMGQPAVSRAVLRGEQIAESKKYSLSK